MEETEFGVVGNVVMVHRVGAKHVSDVVRHHYGDDDA